MRPNLIEKEADEDVMEIQLATTCFSMDNAEKHWPTRNECRHGEVHSFPTFPANLVLFFNGLELIAIGQQDGWGCVFGIYPKAPHETVSLVAYKLFLYFCAGLGVIKTP